MTDTTSSDKWYAQSCPHAEIHACAVDILPNKIDLAYVTPPSENHPIKKRPASGFGRMLASKCPGIQMDLTVVLYVSYTKFFIKNIDLCSIHLPHFSYSMVRKVPFSSRSGSGDPGNQSF